MDTNGLTEYANGIYRATAGLMKRVSADDLGWRPAEGGDWMTLGQLLLHLAQATGPFTKGFVTGEWPEGPEGEGLASAGSMPSVGSAGEAGARLAADRVVVEKRAT